MSFEEQVRAALPEAARLRMQTTLYDDDWEVAVMPWQQLSAKGGVAVVPKDALPEVLRNVGYTAKPTAAVLTQDPDALGLRGYPRTEVLCRLRVVTEGGGEEDVRASRWLVQLGFGEHVTLRRTGREMLVPETMLNMTAKFSAKRGWLEDQIPAAFLVDFLAKHVDIEAVEGVQSRSDGTVTFRCHMHVRDRLLRVSGMDGIFIKQRGTAPMELLWLPEGTKWQAALDLAAKPGALGLVEKGKSGLLAVRFSDEVTLAAFAAEHRVPYMAGVGRWKITGLPASTGVAGLYELLTTLGWEIVEIVYFDERQGVFMSKSIGAHVPAYYMKQGQPRQVKFKALNAAARAMAADKERTAGDGDQTPQPADRVARRLNFCQSMRPAVTNAPAVKSPPPAPPKEAREAPPGGTPEKPPLKERKTGEGGNL